MHTLISTQNSVNGSWQNAKLLNYKKRKKKKKHSKALFTWTTRALSLSLFFFFFYKREGPSPQVLELSYTEATCFNFCSEQNLIAIKTFYLLQCQIILIVAKKSAVDSHQLILNDHLFGLY